MTRASKQFIPSVLLLSRSTYYKLRTLLQCPNIYFPRRISFFNIPIQNDALGANSRRIAGPILSAIIFWGLSNRGYRHIITRHAGCSASSESFGSDQHDLATGSGTHERNISSVVWYVVSQLLTYFCCTTNSDYKKTREDYSLPQDLRLSRHLPQTRFRTWARIS